MNELISIVIPVYNVEKYIVECLQSVARQSYSNLEVIIVDDCGKDDSVKLAESFISSNNLDWIIVHHDKNKGLSGARNTGLRAAHGSYVYFLDSDDRIEPYCIASLCAQLAAYSYDVVVGGYNIFGADNASRDIYICEGDYRDNKRVIEAYSNGLWYEMAWNKLCKREYLLNNGLWFEEGILHEDVVWSFKVATTACSLRAITDCTYGYRIRPESIMSSFSIEKDAKAYAKVFDILKIYMTANGRMPSSFEYTIFEGKKSTLLFSLLKKGEKNLFKEMYPVMLKSIVINPITGRRAGVVSLKQLVRDIHYTFPNALGRTYKQLFYVIVYKWRHKELEGAIWQFHL